MFNNILVICVGNICRSPTAEAILKKNLTDSGKLIHSAGLGALTGKPVEAKATAIMCASDIHLPLHKARQLNHEMLREADLVLVMENRHISSIYEISPESQGKTFLLGKWLDNREIPDPYRQAMPAFEHVYHLIDESVAAWLPYLK